MKPLLPILLSLLLSTSAFCQSAVDSFFNIKTQKLPENWVELIQGKEWNALQVFLVKGKNVKNITEAFNLEVYRMMRFDSGKIIIFSPNYYDTIWRNVFYFNKENTFYFNSIAEDEDKENFPFNIYNVISVTDQYLSLEPIPIDLFYDFKTGRILSNEEYTQQYGKLTKEQIFWTNMLIQNRCTGKWRTILIFKKSHP